MLRLEDELRRICVRRNPPVEVIVSRPLDDEEWPGLLHGWANDVTDDRGLRRVMWVDLCNPEVGGVNA
jgi:hypothetical protein